MQKRPTPELSTDDARYRVNTVARRLGVHTATLKRLERRNLFMPQRDRTGHRRYDERDIARLREILFGNGKAER